MNFLHWNTRIYIYDILIFSLFDIRIYGSDHSSNSVDSNGFGTSYEWHSLQEGHSVARMDGKPLMVIIHREDCSACTELKSKFSVSEVALKLSKYFIMVNIQVFSPEVVSDEFSPDGKYVPRIFFLDPRGAVHTEIFNQNGNPAYKYFYHDMADITTAMKKAIAMFSSNASQEL